MVVFFKRGGNKQKILRKSILSWNRRALENDLMLESPGSMNTPKHVLIVMDGMKEFRTEPLEWALENVINAGSTVTLLGVMPWLNIALSSKTWLDVWPVGLEELSFFKETNEWKSDIKYLKLQKVVDLCNKYGVFPRKKVIMGYPLRLMVVEEITTLHATWVVFDRHQKNDRKFYAGKLPCNMVMMNEDGEVDMIKGRSMIENMDSVVEESPASSLPTPQILISDHLKEILKKQAQDQDP
ncbi:hypothetical protein D8674_017755 [Pyrus ussuriensis x Pyrus communis]|uniref:Uncharacterized protein n=1 Tax=Pyrus ussuriensis x Pyrus communis TaxID=2448454 RepID=A0A5N5HE01_9ROSA|nr:hypothetical protein D8674_017755 [Pyrus ussuriensis x Pyrus communis]